MKANLTNFQKGLTDLRLYIDGLLLEDNLLLPAEFNGNALEWEIKARKLIDHLKNNRASKKQFDYNSVVVSLYGLVERYIEDLLRNYIRVLGKIVSSYKNLPDQIIKNHVNGSFELLKQAEQSRYKGPYTKELIIANLHSCINDPDNFSLNTDAFIQHTANFRKGVIDDLFATAGLLNVCKLVFNHPNFASFLEEQGLDKLQGEIKKASDPNERENRRKSFEDKSFFYLNDLADRRNEVAHGVPSELLDYHLLLEYIDFFNIFGKTLYEVLVHDLLSWEVKHCGFKIGKPTAVFKKGAIVCLILKNASVKKGDYIVGKNSNGLVVGKILELQIDDRPVSEITSTQNMEIGIKVSSEFRKTHVISIIPLEKKIIKYD